MTCWYLCLFSVCLGPPARSYERVRVCNNTNVEVRVIISHALKPWIGWDSGLIEAGSKSSVGLLEEGPRIVAVYDAITHQMLRKDVFTAVSGARRKIWLFGTGPSIAISYEIVSLITTC